jgi:polyribonucleotide nucleotidyltransferase
MDLKIEGLPFDVMLQALMQAKEGRLHILNEMNKVMDKPNPELKPYAPRIVSLTIDREFIGAVIGPGGKIIQEMQRETNSTISIEEKDGVGIIQIMANNKASIDEALNRIKGIVAVPELGQVYDGKVRSIMAYGAFVEILPGKDGLLHISEITWERLETMEGVFKEGEIVKVKLIDIDKKSGKLKLSRKVLLPKPERQPRQQVKQE